MHTKPMAIRVFFTFMITVCLATGTLAQEMNVTRKSATSFQKIRAGNPFHFLHQEMDTALLAFVAALRVTIPPDASLLALYEKIEDQARQLGANAFLITAYDSTQLQADLYFAEKAALEKNEQLMPRNTFYIFAGEKNEAKTYYGFEMNGAMKSIRNGTYFTHSLKEGEQLKLKKGGITGTTIWLKWNQDQPAYYYSIHGFYKEPVVKRTTTSSASKPGRFKTLDNSLGAFLAFTLTPKEE